MRLCAQVKNGRKTWLNKAALDEKTIKEKRKKYV